MRFTERFEDGGAFEQTYMAEVANFHSRETGVDENFVAAALVLKAGSEGRLLELLYEGKIEPIGAVDFDFHEAKDLQFRVV